jgi:hypothetical protein
VTVLFHTATSAVVGAVPDVHDAPRFSAVVLLALITSAANDRDATAATNAIAAHLP